MVSVTLELPATIESQHTLFVDAGPRIGALKVEQAKYWYGRKFDLIPVQGLPKLPDPMRLLQSHAVLL